MRETASQCSDKCSISSVDLEWVKPTEADFVHHTHAVAADRCRHIVNVSFMRVM